MSEVMSCINECSLKRLRAQSAASCCWYHWPLNGGSLRLACRKFQVDAIGLRRLCIGASAGTERLNNGGSGRRMAAMGVGVLRGSAYSDGSTRVLHCSPPLSAEILVGQSRFVLCIDAVP